MLIELRVENLGIIADLLLPIGEGMTVITGETGAGKTLHRRRARSALRRARRRVAGPRRRRRSAGRRPFRRRRRRGDPGPGHSRGWPHPRLHRRASCHRHRVDRAGSRVGRPPRPARRISRCWFLPSNSASARSRTRVSRAEARTGCALGGTGRAPTRRRGTGRDRWRRPVTAAPTRLVALRARGDRSRRDRGLRGRSPRSRPKRRSSPTPKRTAPRSKTRTHSSKARPRTRWAPRSRRLPRASRSRRSPTACARCRSKRPRLRTTCGSRPKRIVADPQRLADVQQRRGSGSASWSASTARRSPTCRRTRSMHASASRRWRATTPAPRRLQPRAADATAEGRRCRAGAVGGPDRRRRAAGGGGGGTSACARDARRRVRGLGRARRSRDGRRGRRRRGHVPAGSQPRRVRSAARQGGVGW